MMSIRRFHSLPLAVALLFGLGCTQNPPAPAPQTPPHLVGASGVGPPPPKPPEHGPYYVNLVTDTRYNLKSGVANAASIIQRAHDDLAAQMLADTTGIGKVTKGYLFIPENSGSYLLESPVYLDKDRIEIIGEGRGTFLDSSHIGGQTACIDQFIIGFPRFGNDGFGHDVTITTANRPDLYPTLDTSVVTATGQKFGFRTGPGGPCFLCFLAHPYTHGVLSARGDNTPDNFTETKQLTVDFCLGVQGGGNTPASGQFRFIGGGDANRNIATPIMIYGAGPNQMTLGCSTQASPFSTPTWTSVDFTLVGTGIHRITAQADMISGTLTAWSDGLQVANVGLPTTGFLNENKGYHPYLIFDGGGTDRGSFGNPSGVDINLYAHQLTASKRYLVAANGSVQTTVGSVPYGSNTDAVRFFGGGSPTGNLGYLQFTEPQNQTARHLFTKSASLATAATCNGYICNSYQYLVASQEYQALRHLRLNGGYTYGQNIAVASPIMTTFEDVYSTNAANAFGNFNLQANYNIRYLGCAAQASDNALYCFNSNIYVEDFQIQVTGRRAICLVGCSANIRKVNVAGQAGAIENVIACYASAYGGDYIFDDITTDNETGAYNGPAILLELHPNLIAPDGAFFSFKHLNFASIGNIPLIQVNDGVGNGGVFSSLTLETATCGVSACIVKLNTNKITGSIDRFPYLSNIPRMINASGGPTRLTLTDRVFTAPPRTLPWVAGAHKSLVPSPVPGQFTEWACVTSGTGLSSKWVGVGPPLLTSPGDLACYIPYTGSNPLGTSSAIYVGLMNNGTEPTIGVSNYGRVLVSNTGGTTGTNLDGSKFVNAVVTLPTLTGPVSATHVGLFSAATGGSPLQPLAPIPGTEGGVARILPSGSTPTFAAGALLSY